MKNTLSQNGSVTRGICQINENNYLQAVKETYNIIKTDSGAAVENGGEINPNAHVSMNMWGLTAEFMDVLESGFVQFLNNSDVANTEYLLPKIIDKLIHYGKASVEMLETNDKWFGVTYADDQAYVEESFKRLVETGMYTSPLVTGKSDKNQKWRGIKDTFKF